MHTISSFCVGWIRGTLIYNYTISLTWTTRLSMKIIMHHSKSCKSTSRVDLQIVSRAWNFSAAFFLNQSLRIGLPRGKTNSKQAPQLVQINTGHTIVNCWLLGQKLRIYDLWAVSEQPGAFSRKLVGLAKKFPHCPYLAQTNDFSDSRLAT